MECFVHETHAGCFLVEYTDSPTGGTRKPDTVYAIEDSFYKKSRFFKIDTSRYPYTLADEHRVTDPSGLLNTVDSGASFTLRNDDATVNLDLEGISKSAAGGFWLVSEGGESSESPNLLIKVDNKGIITKVVTLPSAVAALQVRKNTVILLFSPSLSSSSICCMNRLVSDSRAWPRTGTGLLRLSSV
jgi:hypothetical protein